MATPTWKQIVESEDWKKLDRSAKIRVRGGWLRDARMERPDMTVEEEDALAQATAEMAPETTNKIDKSKRAAWENELVDGPFKPEWERVKREYVPEGGTNAPTEGTPAPQQPTTAPAPKVAPAPKEDFQFSQWPDPKPLQVGMIPVPIFPEQTQQPQQPTPVAPPVDVPYGKIAKEAARRNPLVNIAVETVQGFRQGGLAGGLGASIGAPIRETMRQIKEMGKETDQKAIGSDFLKDLVGKEYAAEVPTTYGDWINRGIGVLASGGSAVLGGIQEARNKKRTTVWWKQSEKDRIQDIKDTINNTGWRATIPSPVPIDFRLPDNLYDMIQTQAQNGLTPEEIDKKIMQNVASGKISEKNTPLVVGRKTDFTMEDFFSPAGAIEAFLRSAGRGEYKTTSDLRKDFLGKSYEERLGIIQGMGVSIVGDMLTDPLVVTQLPKQLVEGLLNAVNKAKHIRNLETAFAYMKTADEQMKAYASKEALKKWREKGLPNRINLMNDAIKEAKERQGKGWEIVRKKLAAQEEKKALPPAKEKKALKEGKAIEIAEEGKGPTTYNVEGKTITNVIPARSAGEGAIERAAREGKYTEGVIVRKALEAPPERKAIGAGVERKGLPGGKEPKALPPHPAVPLGPVGSTGKVSEVIKPSGKQATKPVKGKGKPVGMAIEEPVVATQTVADPVENARKIIKDAGFESEGRTEKAANGMIEVRLHDPRTGSTNSVFVDGEKIRDGAGKELTDKKQISDMMGESYQDKVKKYNDALKFREIEDVEITGLADNGNTLQIKHVKSGKTGTIKLKPDSSSEENREIIKKWATDNASKTEVKTTKPVTISPNAQNIVSKGQSQALPQAVADLMKDKAKKGITVYRGKGTRASDAGDFGRGIYYSSKKEVAEQYGQVTKSVISLKNPLVVNDKEGYALADMYGTVSGKPGYSTGAGAMEPRLEAAQRMTDDLMKKGHDGVVVLHKDGQIEIVDFSPYRKVAKKPAPIKLPGEKEVVTFDDYIAKKEASALKRAKDLEELDKFIKEGKVTKGPYTEPDAEPIVGTKTWKEALAKESGEMGVNAEVTQSINKSTGWSPMHPEDFTKEQLAKMEENLKKYGFEKPSDVKNVKPGEIDPEEPPQDGGYYMGSLFGSLQQILERRAAKRLGVIEDGLGHWRKPVFSVIKPWELLGKKRTGYAIKDIYSVDDAFQQEGVNWMGKLAKEGGVGRYTILDPKKQGRWSMDDMSEIVLSGNNRERFESLPRETQERIKGGVKVLRDFQAWAKRWYHKHGVDIDFKKHLLDANREQLSAINKIIDDMKASPNVQYWEKEVLLANGLQTPAGMPKEINRKQLASFLRQTYNENVAMAKELEKFEYIHIPYDMWFESGKSMDRAATLKALRIANGHKRKTLFIEDLIEAGAITREQINVFDVMASYTHRLGKDMGLLNVKKIAMEEGLLSLVKSKGGAGRLPGFERMPAWQAPMFSDTWMHPAFREWMTDFRYQTYNQNILDKGFSLGKMWQFVEPLFLPYYDAYQSALTLAFKNPFKVAKSLYNAGKMMLTKSPEYYEHLRMGLSSQPVSPPWSQMADTLERMKSPTFGAYIKNAMKNKNWSIIKPIYNVLWETAWTGDRLIRLMATDYLVKFDKLSPFRANQLAALFFSDYANVPINTRRSLNKIFFTPTFKITMGRLFKEQVKAFFNTAYKLSKGQKPTYEQKQLAKSLVVGVGGMLFGVDQLMTKGFGYERDQFARRYYKMDDDPDNPGEKREHVVVFSNPMNLIPKYFYMAKDIFDKFEHDDRLKTITNAVRWEIHPIYRVALDMFMNRKADGSRIVEPFEYDDWTARAIKLRYGFKEILKLSDAILADPESEKNKEALEKYRHDVGNFYYYLNEPATFSYFRIPKADQAYKRIQRITNDFKVGLKSVDEKGELTAEKEIQMIRNFYRQYDKELEDLLEAVDENYEKEAIQMEREIMKDTLPIEEEIARNQPREIEPAPLSVPGATIKK